MIIAKEMSILEDLIKHPDVVNQNVSKVSAYWHIDHALKVIIRVHEQLVKSKPENYKPRLNLKFSILYLFGVFPRGKVNAPKVTISQKDKIEKNDLEEQFLEAEKALFEIAKLPKKHFFHHFIFGDLNTVKSIRLLRLHTNHHLKIIADIKENP